MTTRNDHFMSGFRDHLAKVAAKVVKNKPAMVSELMKSAPKPKPKGKLGGQWRAGSPLAVGGKQDIGAAYGRDGANAQHGSFEAQSSDAQRGSHYDSQKT
jgi:hypothetical protein